MAKKPAIAASPLTLLLTGLELTVDTVLQDAADQPKLFKKAIDYRIAKMEERADAKMQLEASVAEQALKTRKKFSDDGEKLTEGHLESILLVHVGLGVNRNRLAEAERGEEYSKLLLEAYRMRRDSLQVIAQIAGRDISMERSMDIATAKLKDAESRLHEKYPAGEEEEG